MHRRKRNRIRFTIVLVCAILAALALAIRLRLYPLIDDMAKTRVMNEATNLINDAIDMQITSEAIDYASIVSLETDDVGNVKALRTNMTEINRLKTQVLSIVNQEIMNLSLEEIGVPIGNLIMPEFFAGRGFFLPVKIVSIRSSGATFENAFSQAGINQTLHQILMDVTVDITVLTPGGTQDLAASSQVVVAETVIVGNVPDSYVMFDAAGQKIQNQG